MRTMDFVAGSPDSSNVSNISFPSHVSGLESFTFDDTTRYEDEEQKITAQVDAEEFHYNGVCKQVDAEQFHYDDVFKQHNGPSFNDELNITKTGTFFEKDAGGKFVNDVTGFFLKGNQQSAEFQDATQDEQSHNTTLTQPPPDEIESIALKDSQASLSFFLKTSSPPPGSREESHKSLNESSVSMSNLEAMQAGLQDSFLKSHSEDFARDRKLEQYLNNAKPSTEKQETLTKAIQQSADRANGALVNNTIENSLQKSSDHEINQTEEDSIFLKQVRQRLEMSTLDKTDNSKEMSCKELQLSPPPLDRTLIEDLEKGIRQIRINSQSDETRSSLQNVQRPNLDGSSSDEASNVATNNFARTDLRTMRRRSDHLARCDSNTLSDDRESVVSRDTVPPPERQHAEGLDWGRGTEVGGGGDGSSGHSDSDMGGDGGVSVIPSQRVIINIPSDDEEENNSAPLLTPPNRERPVGESSGIEPSGGRQVQFSSVNQTFQQSSSNSTTSNSQHENLLPPNDSQDSRLSSRFFLAASTPFKEHTHTTNWLNQTSFQQQQNNYTLDTPNSTMMSRLQQQHGEPPDWTLLTTQQDISPTEEREQPSSLAKQSARPTPYNPFDNPHQQQQATYNPFDVNNASSQSFGQAASFNNEDFQTDHNDHEGMFDEDEKQIARENNSIYKTDDNGETSVWSVDQPSTTTPEEGDLTRFSTYFKAKSKPVGSLSFMGAPRPKFSDDSRLITTPPACDPQPLIDNDETLVTDVTKQSRKSSTDSQKCETPKSHTLSTHKRLTDTVLLKRQLVGSADKTFKLDDKKNKTKQPSFTVQQKEMINKSLMTSKNEVVENILADIQPNKLGVKTDVQLEELANYVSSITGTEASIIYNILKLLPKKNSSLRSSGSEMTSSTLSQGKISSTSSTVSYANTDSVAEGLHSTRVENKTSGSTRQFYEKVSSSISPVPDYTGKNHSLPEYAHTSRDKAWHQQRGNSQPELFRDTVFSTGSTQFPSTQHNVIDTLASSVIIPLQVQFNNICVGTHQLKYLQIHNSNNFWLQCKLNAIFCALNGKEINAKLDSVFLFPPKIQLEPHSSDNIKLKFTPHAPGAYILKLEVLACPLTKDPAPVVWSRVGSVVDVYGTSEAADVDVVLNSARCLDFGEVMFERCVTQNVCLLNKSSSDIPITLCIASGSTYSKCFSFKENNANVLTTLVKGRKNDGDVITPSTVCVQLVAPSKAVASEPTEQVSCQIDIQTETSPVIPIASVTMCAVVGSPRLHSLRSLQDIEFCCALGKNVSRQVPVRNVGGITMQVQVKMVGCSQFTVTPTELRVAPGCETHVTVQYTPEKDGEDAQGQLAMTLLDSHEQYEWGLCGKAQTIPAAAPSLLCNKLALNWSGVNIGQSRQQKFLLRNSSLSQPLQLSVSIDSAASSNFQIQSNCTMQQKCTNRFEATLKPQAELPVHVLYIPSSLAPTKSTLVLRVINGTTKFVVPLAGYGGTSNLEINGAKFENNQFTLHTEDNISAPLQVMLRNNGSRSAFVSLNCYLDSTLETEHSSKNFSITPNNFVLQSRTSQQINITSFSNDVTSNVGVMGYLVISSGDEILRQMFKRTNPSKLSSHLDLSTFHKDFTDEETCNEDHVIYSGISDWLAFFQSHVTKTVIKITRGETSLVDYDVFYTPAQKLPARIMPAPQNQDKETTALTKSLEWDISPLEILLNTTLKTTSVKLQLINYTDVHLPFEFSWPAQTLVITPCKDKIPARSHLGVRVNAKPSFLSRPQDMPWVGRVYIQCNQQQKCIKVHVRNDIASEETPITKQTQKLLHDVSLVPHQHHHTLPSEQRPGCVTVTPHILEFNEQNGKERHFTVTNSSKDRCKWILSSIAPPYYKSNTGTTGGGDIARATFSAFRFAKHSGKLESQQSVQLSVSFHPRDSGIYSQFWDFEAIFDDKTNEQLKYRLELIGKQICTSKISPKKIGTAKPILKPHNKSEIKQPDKAVHKDANTPSVEPFEDTQAKVFVKDKRLSFENVSVGESVEKRFRLCNDSQTVQKVRVSGMEEPFSVVPKHTRLSIKPKSYIRVPVYFTPTSSGTTSKCTLNLTTDAQHAQTNHVELVGHSV